MARKKEYSGGLVLERRTRILACDNLRSRMCLMRLTRTLVAAAMVMTLVGLPAAIEAQRHRATADFARYDKYLREVLPDADTFRFVDTGTPHYRGYRTNANGKETLVGFGFFNVDFATKVHGYKGEIWMLIGMDPGGTLTEVSIVYHNEPFGYFSIDLPKFAAQFSGKSVLERLTVGDDIDAVSRATITNNSAVRAIRDSARRMAREFLAERASEQ